MDIGKAIRFLRKEKTGMRSYQLAKNVGVTQSYLSQIETGKRKPSMEVLEKLALCLGTPLPLIFWFSIERNDLKFSKRMSFDLIKPSIDAMINSLT